MPDICRQFWNAIFMLLQDKVLLFSRRSMRSSLAIGMINAKTTAVRLIPVPGKTVGERAEFGGLLGGADIMAVQKGSAAGFINRGGRIPAPIHSFKN